MSCTNEALYGKPTRLSTPTGCKTLSGERARQSFWDGHGYRVVGEIKNQCDRHENLGSRGLLEVWLDLSHLNSRR